jgi:hypothetical protein
MAMLGANGGLIGKQRRPSVVSASGIWSLNEQANNRREANWPVANAIQGLGPILWYDFADATTVTTSSGRVSTIADKGSAGRTLSKSTTGPTYGAGINGLNCCDWGNTTHSNYLRNTLTTAIIIADVYIVLDAAFGSTFPSFNGLITAVADPGWQVGGSSAGTGLSTGSMTQAFVNGSATNTITSVLPAINSPSILRLKRTDNTAFSTGTGGFQIGTDRSNANRGWYGLVGEVVVFSTALDSSASTSVLAALAAKWGITLV